MQERTNLVFFITVLVLLLCPAWLSGADGTRKLFVPGELLVKYRKQDASAVSIANKSAHRFRLARRFEQFRIEVLRLEDDSKLYDAMADLKMNPDVELVEPNYCIYPAGTFPNDPGFSSQWAFYNGSQRRDIRLPEAWDLCRGDPNQLIAILDTGVDITHPDLEPNIWRNPNEIPGNGIDDDGNGYVDDVNGWDFFNRRGAVYNVSDGDYHGTHVAGIIAAATHNGRGVAGINWQAKLVVLKFIGPQYGTVSSAIEAINYARARGIRIMNASWGSGAYSQALRDAIEQSGALVIAAVGNSANDTDLSPFYPASYDLPNVLAVSSTDRLDALSSFSNFGGRSVHIAAPGTDIYSTYPGGTYAWLGGTSMAAPHVTGVAALVNAYRPRSPQQLKNLILNSADRLPQLATRSQTGGRLNAYEALRLPDDDPELVVSLFKPSANSTGITTVMANQSAEIAVRVGYGAHLASGATVVAAFDTGQSSIVLQERAPGYYTGTWVPQTQQTRDALISVTATMPGRMPGNDLATVRIAVPTYSEQFTSHTQYGSVQSIALYKGDDEMYSYLLPFDFPFYEQTYRRIYISCNGYLDFENSVSDFANTAAKLKQNRRIAVLWDDLDLRDSGAGLRVVWPGGDFVVFRWIGKTLGYNQPVDAEAVLYRDGRIQFNYGAGNTNLTATVGISRGDGLDYVISAYDGATDLNYAPSCRYTKAGQTWPEDSQHATPMPTATPPPSPTPTPAKGTIFGTVTRRGLPVANVAVSLTGTVVASQQRSQAEQLLWPRWTLFSWWGSRSSSGSSGGSSGSTTTVSRTVRTDSAGAYEFSSLEPGTYTLRVAQWRVGYRSTTVTLSVGENRRVNFAF